MAAGIGHVSGSYTKYLDKNGLKGARIGGLREPMGRFSDWNARLRQSWRSLQCSDERTKSSRAILVDPIVIPNLNELLGARAEIRTTSMAA